MSEFEVWNEMGNIYYKTGAMDEAIRSYQKVIELNPGCGQSYSNLASVLIGQDRFAEAIPMLQKGIEHIDNAVIKAFLWDQLGDTYQKLEDFSNACDSYRKAIELDPNDTTFAKKLIDVEQAYRNRVSGSKAQSNQGTYSSIKPVNTEMGSPVGEPSQRSEPRIASYGFENRESVSIIARNAFTLSDQTPGILGDRTLSNSSANADTKEAIETPGRGESHNHGDMSSPTNPPEMDNFIEASPNGLLRLGILHGRKREFERALQFLSTAREMAERSQDQYHQGLAYYAMAGVEIHLGKIEEAIQSYKRAANLAPEHIFPWRELGDLNCRLARYEEARAAFQQAIEHNPKDPLSWNGLGDVYHRLGRFEDAIASYQHGNAFENQIQEEDVLLVFEKAMDSELEKPQVWNEAGNIYFAAGAFIDAIISYRKANELAPADATFQVNLAKAEQAQENAKAGTEPPAAEKSTGFHPQALPHIEPFTSEDTFQENEDSYNAQSILTGTRPFPETGVVPEKVSSSPAEAARLEPEAAFWMANPVTIHKENNRQAGSYVTSDDKSIEDSAKFLPAIALQTHQENGFSSDQGLTETDYDRARVFVQLPPYPIKPVRTVEINNVPATMERKTSFSPPRPPTTGSQPSGQASSGLNVLEKDIAAARRVTELNPLNDRAWDTLGNKYETAGLHIQAITAFEQAIALDPQKEVYYYHLGIALAYQKEYEKAIQALEKVLSLNPDYMLAHCALSGYYRRLGMETEAQEHMLIARPGIESENEYNRACFESISGNADQAIELLQVALEKQQIQPELVRSDPDLDFIRNDPRFETLLYKNRIIS